MKGGFWIKTPHRSHVDANGELTSSASWRDVPEHIVNPLPSMYASSDAASERYVILHADRKREKSRSFLYRTAKTTGWKKGICVTILQRSSI